jgi:hypothetical protein
MTALPETCVAIRPAAEGAAGVARLWGRNSDFWPQGATLRVLFMDGSKSQQDRAWFRFQKIDELVNLSFVRVPTGPSEIRVSFAPGDGHWSYVGRYNARIPQSKPTMNLALTSGLFGDGSREWDRVALHEVLHAAGFQHEHQSPQATLDWNRPAVYADYWRTQGWDRWQTDYQVLNRSDAAGFNGSAFDPKSIMQYPVPKEHLLSGKAIGWNRKLTETDVRIIREVYP